MRSQPDPLAEAVVAGAVGAELEQIPLPESHAAYNIHRGSSELVLEETPLPPMAPDEVMVAVMASSLNHNTLWAIRSQPISTFAALDRYAAKYPWLKHHSREYHTLGSDASGVIVRVGSAVRRWRPGDKVCVATAVVDFEEEATHEDAMQGETQRAWGYETNFGGLAQYTTVRASQLIRKPSNLSWVEAAVNPLCAGTAYRMLVGVHGARMRQGEVVLIWGAAGGLGSYAAQFVANGGGLAVGIVGSESRRRAAEIMGCVSTISRSELGLGDNSVDTTVRSRRLGQEVRRLVGRDPDIVFEHTGQETFPLSAYVAARQGRIVTCGSSSGYDHQYDNRHLWMKMKRIIGCHGANLHEQAAVGALLESGLLKPALSVVSPFEAVPSFIQDMEKGRHLGKIAVRVLVGEDGHETLHSPLSRGNHAY